MIILPDGSTCSFKEGLKVKEASIARQKQACVPDQTRMKNLQKMQFLAVPSIIHYYVRVPIISTQ